MTMRLVSKLYFAFIIMLAIALSGAALAGWSARQAAFHMERIILAHQVYESYLALSNHTYQLFKQFGDALLIGDRDFGAGESELLGKMRNDIASIRRLIAREIQIVGDEETEELELLAKIEQQIEELIREYQEIIASKDALVFTENWERLSGMLDKSIDEDFNELIQEAIDEEAEEVRETMAETTARLRLFQILVGVFIVIAALTALASLWTLLRSIKQPFENLLKGTTALSRGDLEHRIEVVGPVEISNLARAFNRMAGEISTRETALSQYNNQLEQTVTERTAELERLLDTLKTSEANRRRLLADVSHELRTPLTIIKGEADIALRGKLKPAETYREALENCRDAAKHTARLVDDLLFVARREAGEIQLKIVAVDLAELLPQVIDEHHTLTTKQSATISFTSALPKAVVRADEGRLRQVLAILLENALRYGGRDIDVRLDSMPTGYAIAVSDNGPGLSEDEQVHAFERFFRGSNAADRYGQGVGLGLPVAKAIIEAQGGEIDLESKSGEGLTVVFTLPVQSILKAVS